MSSVGRAPRTASSPRLISTQFMIQIIWRSWCSDDSATFQPRCSGPSRFSAGTSTSSRKTSQNVSSEIDAIRMGSILTPGACRSRIRQEMPRCFGASGSVRAYRVHHRDRWACVVHILCPFTRKTSPSRSARVRRPAKSDPASGSDMPSAHHSSPRSRGTNSRSIWAGVPNSRMPGAATFGPAMLGSLGADRSAASIRTSIASRRPSDRPPCSRGQVGWSHPPSNAAR